MEPRIFFIFFFNKKEKLYHYGEYFLKLCNYVFLNILLILRKRQYVPLFFSFNHLTVNLKILQ